MKKITIVLLLLLVTVGVFGTTYYVSVDGDDQNPGTQEEPFRNIQHAIDVAEDRDAILVGAGTYYENISLYGRSISLIGDEYEETIIDGSNADTSVASFNNCHDIRMENFTLENGIGELHHRDTFFTPLEYEIIDDRPIRYGGGIYSMDSNISLNNLKIIQNQADYGGGIYLEECQS